jgi:hypothetical protein
MFLNMYISHLTGGRRNRDRMDLQLHAQSVHITIQNRKFETGSGRGVLDTTLCDKVCQCIATRKLLSKGTPVFSTNKTNRHDITEILLKEAL